MPEIDKDFQAAHEIGKIYNSFVDKKILCDFFIESALVFIHAGCGLLFLAGKNDRLWLESSRRPPQQIQPIRETAQKIFEQGKPSFQKSELFVPLIVRNVAIGIAYFSKDSAAGIFSEKDAALASDLAAQLGSALKNILLFEENLKMERLSTIGQTMGMVMHEMKNIVQLAHFSEDYLKMGIQNQNAKNLTLGMAGISKALREMEGFTYEILSLTKDYKIAPEPVDLPSLLEELRTDLQAKAEDGKIRLDVEVEKPFPQSVEGESRSLYRALLNLAKNALEAVRNKERHTEPPFVRIRARVKDKDAYQIVIQDTGEGMSDEVKAKLFQAFFSTKGEKGTGLGLLVIDRTVKAHGGEIHFESQAGKGTTFTLTLPKTLSRTA